MLLFSQVCDVPTAEKTQIRWEDGEMLIVAHVEIMLLTVS